MPRVGGERQTFFERCFMKKKRRYVLKAALGFAAIATSLAIGMSAGCSNNNNTTDDDDDNTKTKLDSQIIKNGNFEFYSDNKGLYPISNPENWTGGTNGNSSASMSGVIDTSKKRWDYLTDTTLPKTLEDNDDLKDDDKNKKDYNGALTDDMPYKNPHEATDSSASDEDKAYIDNPFTHKYSYDDQGRVISSEDGSVVDTYEDEDGKLYLDEKFETPLETSVLMIHNYRRNYFTGTEGYFSSSTTTTLEASTAAEISVWVKTSDLYFDGAKGVRTEVESERGAYIKVNTQVGGNSLDSFIIENINTEKLNSDGANNGWVQYTVYVEASNFADTTVTVTLGLGQDDIYTVEGYAFFDDVTLTKYLNRAEMEEKSAAFGEKIRLDDHTKNANVSYPLSPDDVKTEFRVDKVTYQTNGSDGGYVEKTDENNFADRHFFIDLASSTEQGGLEISGSGITAGLTVEETSTGKYVSADNKGDNKYTTKFNALDNGADVAFIPNKLGEKGLNVKDDVLAHTAITGDAEWKFTDGGEYGDLLTEALKTAVKLPGVKNDATTALVMLSARGAAYEAQITNDEFTLKKDEHALVSFWVKTSEMNGASAAKFTVVDTGDKTNKADFSLDSTTESLVNIGDNENVYNGWVKCFIRVSNASETDKTFKIVANFGNTTIKGTTNSSYTAGWMAMTNLSVTPLSEDVYGYSSGAAHAATLTFSETAQNTTHNFDTELGDKNEIKDDLAIPSTYTGVYGESLNIKPDGNSADKDDYDKTNSNAYAGILNKENFENGNYDGNDWFNRLTAIAVNGDETSIWNKYFDKYTVQPLLIVNTVKNFSDDNKIYNYGYIGNPGTVSANGYTAISVRVKASAGAIANVYLVEDGAAGNKVLNYALPKYNFWYDDNGNILKGEPDENATTTAQKKANIAYTLRDDGLYENGDGKLYANFYNLSKYYDIRFEHETFYNENGERVNFEDLVQGETYYANAQKTEYAPHHLIAGGNGNNKVYEYNGGVGGEATYFYLENNKTNKNKVVHGIDTSVAKLRYDNTAAENIPYQFTIDTTTADGAKYADKWVTVTFYVHAGSEAKNYRLELWSGKRDEKSIYAESAADSYVVFDYSNVTLDQSTYDGLVGAYTNDIIADYRENIEGELADNDGNIADLEKLADKKSTLYNYEATYYTFSLYDSEAFIPFNAETAEKNQTGYSYNYSDYQESLALLKVEDDDNLSMSAFIDYSVIDKDIEIIGAPTVPDDEGNDGENETTPANVWLLAASIALVAAIFVAIAAIFIRDLVKKRGHKKTAGKNSYNFNKNKRYVKKYVKANGEAPSIAEGDVDESLLSDSPADGEATDATTAEAENAESAEQTQVDETAESEAQAETKQSEEAPSAEEPSEEKTEEAENKNTDEGDKPDDGENK